MEAETTKFAELTGYSYDFDAVDERREDSWICTKMMAKKLGSRCWTEERLNEIQNWGETVKCSTIIKFEIFLDIQQRYKFRNIGKKQIWIDTLVD